MMMALLPILLLLMAGVEVGWACQSARMETYKCLTDFFNHTNQRLPAGLERILGQAKPSRARRDGDQTGSDVATSGDRNQTSIQRPTSPFKEHWCGPFADYVSCMEHAREKCDRAALYTCSIMTTFSLMYGTYICDVDLQPWVASNIRSCKASSDAVITASFGSVTLTLSLVLVWRSSTSFITV